QDDPGRIAAVGGDVPVDPGDRLADVVRVVGEADPPRRKAKHTLALVNRGGGTTAELLELARELRDGVHAAFGVTLAVEPTLVGVAL
ncbi:MAG TPA: hypothetical protein VFH44_02215, partial [Solirubrobacterales bacterium]|nr:hypothetical protein [Solirubrobacterales bacterium]